MKRLEQVKSSNDWLIEECEIKLRAIKNKEVACKKYMQDKNLAVDDWQFESTQEDEDAEGYKTVE